MTGIAKFVQFVLIAVLGSAGATIVTGNGLNWNTLVLLIGAAVLFFKKNTVTQPWARAAIAVFTAGATVLVSAWTDQVVSAEEVVQILLAVLGAIQVGVVSDNEPLTGEEPISA
jgi:hypothetical protein